MLVARVKIYTGIWRYIWRRTYTYVRKEASAHFWLSCVLFLEHMTADVNRIPPSEDGDSPTAQRTHQQQATAGVKVGVGGKMCSIITAAPTTYLGIEAPRDRPAVCRDGAQPRPAFLLLALVSLPPRSYLKGEIIFFKCSVQKKIQAIFLWNLLYIIPCTNVTKERVA